MRSALGGSEEGVEAGVYALGGGLVETLEGGEAGEALEAGVRGGTVFVVIRGERFGRRRTSGISGERRTTIVVVAVYGSGGCCGRRGGVTGS